MKTRSSAALAALLLLVVAVGCSTNPVTGRSQIDLIGEGQEVELGARMFPQAIQGSLGPIDDREAQRMVDRIGQAVAAVGHRPQLPYSFAAVNEPEVNAFALPGGKIAITRGLLTRMESEDGLAAVLGHEVGHVTARHVVAGYNRQILANLLLLGGQVYMESQDVRNRDLIGLGAMLGTQLALARYSREQERESDDLGLDYAIAAGFSPRGMIETHAVLLSMQEREPSSVERWFASHPMSRERLETARARVTALPPDIRDRPLQTRAYRDHTASLMRAQPAWEAAREGRRMLAGKQVRQAEQRLEQAVRLAPNEGVLRTLHATALATLGEESAAVDQAVQGARLADEVFVSRFLAGQFLIRRAPREALGHLQASERLVPGLAEVAYLSGLALENIGERQNAASAYRAAYERDPQGEVGAAAARRLQALGVVPGSMQQR